jgi:hypothetical protein
MSDLTNLEELFSDLDSDKPNENQLYKMYEIYTNELVDDYIEIDGLRLVFKSQKSWLNPEAITERMMEEGPTSGTTFRFLRWAIATTSAPGSATAGQPASEITPME